MKELMFKRRVNLLPKNFLEYPCLLFIIFIIPVTYWFEIWVVLPCLFAEYPIVYWSCFLFGHFILHNVVGNLLGILMLDTSINGRIMPTADVPGVRYCSICNSYTPPRSFHCSSCNTCILKRDHHCVFTSCCIGFFNHRFFFYFVFYLMIATSLFAPFNLYFVKNNLSLNHYNLAFAILFPFAALLLDLGSDTFDINLLYLLISVIGIIGILFCTSWFYFHFKLILKGTVVYEMKNSNNIYNLGKRKNLEMVFGQRWPLTWVSPFLYSQLPCDGISFPVPENIKDK